ncbi:MAG TPA: hypothetical protein VFD58_03725 [Blastocatellia bacterium]|nr:hypothetical protein [Blastocatellia bacterium]
MVKQFYFSLAVLAALVFGPQVATAQQPPDQTSDAPTSTRPRQVLADQIYLQPPPLSGNIETANGQYRINLVNQDQSRTVRGYAVIQLGTAEQQSEAIKLRFTLAPQEGMLYPLWPLAATGDYYTLLIYDLRGVMIFQKVAPVRKGNDANWTVAPPMAAIVTPSLATAGAASPEPEVRIQAKLTGGESENDPFVLAFELTALRPITGAGVSVTGKGLNQRKVADLRGTTLVQFKLPDDLPEQKLSYLVTDSTGRLVGRGEVDLHTLLADDYVSVSEVRPDKPAYAPGDPARLTVGLQGNSPHGFRIEVVAKDGKGTIFFRDMRKPEPGSNSNSLEFAVTLPQEVSGPVTFSYKVFDAQTGKLFDSGDSELAVTAPASAVQK